MDGLRINDTITIPEAELEWRFLPTGGPGGQHANRSATRAEVVFDLGASTTFEDDIKMRMLEQLGNRAPGGVVTVAEDSSRSQWRNRQGARARLAALLRDAMRVEPMRRPTRPSRAARRRRLEDKRRRSHKKQMRRRPEEE
jgi:ribosome-associated protein